MGWSVVAASNRAEDRAGTHKLISPLLNRFVHLDLLVSPEDWQDWAAAAGVVPEVRGFIRFKPKLLFDFDPATNPRAFPTPRSWSFVSEILPVTPKTLLHRVVAGCVGDGPAAEFVAFLELYQSLPDVDAVLASPTTSVVPREPSVLCALVGALIERVRADRSKAAGFVSYATRLPLEYFTIALIAIPRVAFGRIKTRPNECRTEAEYTALLKRAGFKLEKIIPTPTPVKILESLPV